MSKLTPLGRYRTVVDFNENGHKKKRVMWVELEADLAAIAAQLAWVAAQSRQRPRTATLSHRRIVLTVLKESPLSS